MKNSIYQKSDEQVEIQNASNYNENEDVSCI